MVQFSKELSMYAVMGVTGKVGAAVASGLLQAGQSVVAVMRDASKAGAWTSRGCAVAIAKTEDATALAAAFRAAEGVFVMLPPIFDPRPGFPEAQAAIASIRKSLVEARPQRVVCLSTIGARASQPNLLSQLGMLEQALESLPVPVTFLRASWFIDNAALDVASARSAGRIDSYLQPLDKQYSMVAARDVGAVAAGLLREEMSGHRVVELEGPGRVTPNQIAQAFGAVLKKQVTARAVPRNEWESSFRGYGMQNPTPRMQMLDGFNEGWIAFAENGKHALRGTTSMEQVIASLISGQTDL
jgi:NAD(P)H dehydrogenase (quinone)